MDDRDLPALEEAIGEIWEIAAAAGPGSVPHPLRDRAGDHHVRVRRLRAARPVHALDPRQGVPADEDHVRLRPQQDLRAGDQHQPGLRLPAGEQLACFRTSWSSPTSWARRLLQEQPLLRAHQPRDAGDRQSATPSASGSTSFEHGRRRSSASWTPCSRSRSTSTRTRACGGAGAASGEAPASARRALRRPAAPGRRGARRQRQTASRTAKFPPEPEKDLLLFLAGARDRSGGLAARRDRTSSGTEQHYFVPQMQTKIMNEGWAIVLARAHHARAGPDRRGVRRVRASCTRRLHAAEAESTRTTSG